MIRRSKFSYIVFTVACGVFLSTISPMAYAANSNDDSLDFSSDDKNIDFNKDTSADDAALEKELNEEAPANSQASKNLEKAAPDSADDFDLNAEEKKMGSDKQAPTEEKANDLDVEPLAEPESQPVDNKPPGVAPTTNTVEAPVPPAPPSEASFSDEPNVNYEAKLHDIYQNFYSKKIPEDQWQNMVGQKSAEKYQIQKGDNLWNVSKTIFGDGNYWPKVWSLNSSIKNPHLVSPNNSIQFLLGDESQPPSFAVTENATNVNVTENKISTKDEVSQETKSDSQANSEGKGDEAEPEIPPPLNISRPVVKHLPPSLPEWQDQAARYGYDSSGISYGKRKILEVKDQTPLVSYIAEVEPTAYGTVSEVETGHDIASSYQYIYVSMKPGQGEIGKTYLAVANRGEIQSVHSSISGFLGYAIDVQGEVQLVERVDAMDEKAGEMYRALVLNILNPVAVGSQLIDGKLENVQITEVGERSQVVAQIIGGSFFNRRQVYGNESIAYINRGEDAGLKVGQILPIRANRLVRNPDTAVKGNVRPIGWMRVIKTTKHFATCLVIRVWSDVLTGDLTGSGNFVQQDTAGNSDIDQDAGVPAKSLNEELDDKDDFDQSTPATPSKDDSDLNLDE